MKLEAFIPMRSELAYHIFRGDGETGLHAKKGLKSQKAFSAVYQSLRALVVTIGSDSSA